MANWHFPELNMNGVRRQPSEHVLFKNEQSSADEYAGTDQLVREILQNSLDAASGEGPVRVRLALFSRNDMPSDSSLAEYFHGLESPLSAKDEELTFQNGLPELTEGFLVCEDFNTRGLEGDPLLRTDPEPGGNKPEDFFWFWRNIGRSGKTGDDLGRWGLGKTVYRAVSRTGCMFGLSVRRSDQRALLMGQAVLAIHKRGEKEYVPEGFWGKADKSGFPLPVEEPAEIERFKSDWHLRRRNEPGLSVVAPFVANELKGENVAQAVAVNFFIPILRGELAVEVEFSGRKLTFAQDTLLAECANLEWKGARRKKRSAAPPVEFAKECLGSASGAVDSNVLGKSKVPKLDVDSFEARTLALLRNNFKNGELVAARIRLTLHYKRSGDVEGAMTVFVRKDAPAIRDSYYVREGMTITKLNSQSSRKGINGLVLVEKGALAAFLGDTEGASHEDWNKTEKDRVERHWKKPGWVGIVDFCRGIIDALVGLLNPPSDEPDYDLLSEFFSLDETRAPQRKKSKGKENRPGTNAFPSVESPPKWFTIQEQEGGFRIARNASVAIPEKARLKVSVAYDIPNGNPLKKWSRFDFNFANNLPNDWHGKGIKPHECTGNTFVLEITDGDFYIRNTQFDRFRDLFVRVDDISGNEE